jgi:hypothetical protein
MFREIGNFSHILLNMFQGKNCSDFFFLFKKKINTKFKINYNIMYYQCNLEHCLNNG